MAAYLWLSVSLGHAKEDVEHTALVKLAITQMRIDGLLAADNATNYALTGKADRRDIYERALTSFREKVAQVRALTADNPAQQAAITGIDTRMQARFVELQAVVDTRDKSGRDAAVTLVEKQISERTFENRDAILGMLAEEDRLMEERRERVNRLGSESVLAIVVASVSFASLLLFFWNTRRGDLQERLVIEARRERLELENAALAERARVSEFQERFIGVLGHDLRNPLGALSMGIDLLKREVPSEQRTLDRMASSAKRMARMIDQLLDLTRTRLGGGIALTRETTDLGRLTSEIVEELKTRENPGRIRVTSRGDLVGEWDSDRLAQVISNLVGNALHHGAIERPVLVEIEGEDSDVSFSVHNDGIPITATLQRVLFDPFRRGERQSNSQKTAGVGLGLFISKEIIEKHGGRIDVTSTADKGTTFSFSIPRRALPQRTDDGARAPQPRADLDEENRDVGSS